MEHLINQTLLVQVLDLFAKRFEKNAILRGGMVLRLLGCERHTNDLDYVFVPFKSKKDVVEDILKVLSEIPNIELTHNLNSKCLRIHLKQGDAVGVVEVKVDKAMDTEILSTRAVSEAHNLPPRLIRVVSYPIALANKMAAWNERRIIRDVYDTWFFLRMGVKPDHATLSKRLRKIQYSRLVKEEDYFSGGNVLEFFEFMRDKVNKLTEQEILNSLSDSLRKEDIVGINMQFRAEMAKL